MSEISGASPAVENEEILIHETDGWGSAGEIPSQPGVADQNLTDDKPALWEAEATRTPSHTIDATQAYLNKCRLTPLLKPEEVTDLSKRIEAGLYAAHKLEHETLTDDLAGELAALAADGVAAKELMIRANLPLVVNIAKRYARKGVPLLDLIQDGNIALMHAVEIFDYKRGNMFSTPATWWIHQAVQRSYGHQSRLIHLPINQIQELKKANYLVRQIYDQTGEIPGNEEVIKMLGIKGVKMFRDAQLADRPMISLQQEAQETEATLLDKLADDKPGPEQVVVDTYDILYEAVDTLPEREARIIKLIFQLEDGEPMTMKEVGDVVGGLTAERIRQLKVDALKKLRTYLDTR